MAILTGEAIKQEVAAGNITITPYEEKNVQPASIDLRLGSGVKIYASQVYGLPSQVEPTGSELRPIPPLQSRPLDPKEQLKTASIEVSDSGFTIYPGILYLMHTLEQVHTNKYVSVLDGKSSIGRLGVVVHLTAGYGDPGFDGQYTLEVSCIHPVILYPGMKIAQMRFHLVHGSLDMNYVAKGHYVGSKAVGAVPSMAYKQFEENNE